MAKTYKYNKDMFEFFLSDGSTVQAYQIENGNVWTLEIFPPNQSEESFENAQYSGGITFFDKPKAPDTLGGKPETEEWYFQEYPKTFTEALYDELIREMENQLANIKLLEIGGV